jgi:chemotaxis protein MotA
MLAFFGIVLVFAAVFGGYLVEQGNPYVLLQPAELLIVGGAACGIVMVANPPAVIGKMLRGTFEAFRTPRHNRQFYLRRLRMLYEVFTFVQRAGIMAFEADVENPKQSRIFSNYPDLLRDHDTLHFVCDSLRMLVIGVTTPHELDHLMELDTEVQRRGRHEPVNALTAVADALPGLGIVAAVLGVVITMKAIGGSPETVGEKVAAALVGTFLGILLCYGVVGPIASRLETLVAAHTGSLEVFRTATVAFARGSSPILAIEYGRRSIPVDMRPAFDEMEITIRRDAKIPPVVTPQVPDAHVSEPTVA